LRICGTKELDGLTVTNQEVRVLRNLANRWLEHANQPVMVERRRQWQAVKDLKAERPMIFVETCMLSDYIGQDELVCQDPYLRNIEKSLYEIVRHADEIGDDIVVDPYFRIPWDIEISDYGVPIVATHGLACDGSDLGYSFNFGVQSEADFEKLHMRDRRVNREETERQKELLEDIFGDILPVKVGGYDPFNPDPGYRPWLGNLFGGLTMDLFKLIGNDNLLLWVYDRPALIHKMMELIRDDRQAHFRFLEQEGLLYQNLDTWMPCNGSYGFVSDLTPIGEDQEVRLKDCWCWTESQESEPISPTMFNEFFLPYIAEVTRPFGLTYYGCCEGIDDRFEYIRQAIPNLRVVSVSGWSDLFKMGEMLGKNYVYSRKPTPANISGANPYWDLLEKDVRDTLAAAKNCSLEFSYRDVYTINGDRPRLGRWVEMTRALMQG
jgi:hypothetical protein